MGAPGALFVFDYLFFVNYIVVLSLLLLFFISI